MPLISIPSDLGQGGANIGDGTPKLAAILEEHKSAIADLQEASAGKTYAFGIVHVPADTSTGARLFPGARVGMRVASVTMTGNNGAYVQTFDTNQPYGAPPHYGSEVTFNFEEIITVDDQIQQLISGTDASNGNTNFHIFLESV